MTTTAPTSMPLQLLVEHFRPGSFPTWDEQEADMLARICLCCGQPGHYQLMLEAHLAEHGLDQGVCLGADGRVWDGNHRVVAARRLGIDTIPLETEDDAWLVNDGLRRLLPIAPDSCSRAMGGS